MDKLLTIVIPSYNMEKYLDKCLSSLVLSNIKLMEQMEVLIINDGSTDETHNIARKYSDLYPNIFITIDKANGHYGSCINTGLRLAKGDYFRILDADDWFDTDSLTRFLNDLQSIDTDVIFTRHSIHYTHDDIVEEYKYPNMIFNQTLNLNVFNLPHESLKMHCLTYKTNFLKKIKYCQTEGICYTDNEYVVVPLMEAENLYAYDYSLYQYRIGRGEQSVSVKSMVNNVNHYLTVLKKLTEIEIKSNNKKQIRDSLVVRITSICIDVFTLYRKVDNRQKEIINTVINHVSTWDYNLFNKIISRKIKGIPLYKFWYYHPQLYYSTLYKLIKHRN